MNLRMAGPPANSDLSDIVTRASVALHTFQGKKICVLGGTGFIGSWIVNALNYANRELRLGITILVPTRNLKLAGIKHLIYDNSSIIYLEQDLLDSISDGAFRSDIYIHGSTQSSVRIDSSQDPSFYNSASIGLINLLKFIEKGNSIPVIIHLSSGAVYGKQSIKLGHVLAKPIQGVQSILSPYAKAKLETENILSEAIVSGRVRGSNPRLFAFMGPNLPVNAHFAIGNFLRDGLLGRPIQINGNPLTRRSYLYPTDLTVWIFNLMANPVNTPLNLGSDIPIEMGSLVDLIADLTGSRNIRYTNPSAEISNYVPDVAIAKRLLGDEITVSLEDGIQRWAKWLTY